VLGVEKTDQNKDIGIRNVTVNVGTLPQVTPREVFGNFLLSVLYNKQLQKYQKLFIMFYIFSVFITFYNPFL
jgi:hypothetical protein